MTTSDTHAGPARASAILAWALAWGVTGAAIYISGVLNSPRTGPLWVALVGGAISWAVAGEFTFPTAPRAAHNLRRLGNHIIWAGAYLLSFGAVAFAARQLADTLGSYLYMVLGWALGGALGASASTWFRTERAPLKHLLINGVIWLLGFFAGGWAALFGLYLGPELGKISIGWLIGQPAALTLGAGIGMALAGAFAAAFATALTRLTRGLL